MPTSHFLQLNEIMQLIVFTDPTKLLDIGVGFGKYGFLAREYLELWDGREQYSNWQRKIDGIEVFSQYITPVHEFIYDRIYVGNALEILPSIDESYDLILLIDVLEHFDYNEGRMVLQECVNHGKNIIISLPIHIGSQDETFGNIYETHKFQWRKKHFIEFTKKFFLPTTGGSQIVYLGEKYRDIRKLWRRKIFKKNIKLLLNR